MTARYRFTKHIGSEAKRKMVVVCSAIYAGMAAGVAVSFADWLTAME